MVAGIANQVLEFVHQHETWFVELLRRLVLSESPSAQPASHAPVRHVLQTALRAEDFEVREFGRGFVHLYARPNQRTPHAPRQLIVGHYDTVWPVGTLRERPLTVDGNVIRGPGTFDMKGGLAQLVLALKAIRELGLRAPVMPLILINADEEIGSRTSTRQIRRLAMHACRALVLEPSMGEAGALKTERKGIGRFTITVHGKAAHAGLDPDAGVSAILELSHVIQKLFALNDAGKGITVNVGTVDGGVQPNVVAPHSTAVADVRVPSVADGKRIEHEIRSLTPTLPGTRLRIDGGIGRPSMEATPRNQALWQQVQAVGSTLGMELLGTRVGGGSDGNTTSQYTATIDGLGPVGHGAHATHEFIYLDRTLERAALLTMLLLAPPASTDNTGAAT